MQISMRWPENQGDDMWEVHPIPMEVDTKPWQIWKNTFVAKGHFWTKPWMTKMNGLAMIQFNDYLND